VLLTGGEKKKNDKYCHSKQKKAEQQTIGDEPHSGIRGLDIDVKGGENNGKTITHC
jgi:hypothetical protein